jgi:hypothetical protein
MNKNFVSIAGALALTVSLAGCATTSDSESALPDVYSSASPATGEPSVAPSESPTSDIMVEEAPTVAKPTSVDETIFVSDNPINRMVKVGEVIVLKYPSVKGEGFSLSSEKIGIVMVPDSYEFTDNSGVPIEGLKAGVTRVAVASVARGSTEPSGEHIVYSITVTD